MVEPLLPGLIEKRQAAQTLHPLIGRRHGHIGARRQTGIGDRLLDRIARRPDHDCADAEAKREQVTQSDRASGRHGVVDRPVEATQHAAVGEFG